MLHELREDGSKDDRNVKEKLITQTYLRLENEKSLTFTLSTSTRVTSEDRRSRSTAVGHLSHESLKHLREILHVDVTSGKTSSASVVGARAAGHQVSKRLDIAGDGPRVGRGIDGDWRRCDGGDRVVSRSRRRHGHGAVAAGWASEDSLFGRLRGRGDRAVGTFVRHGGIVVTCFGYWWLFCSRDTEQLVSNLVVKSGREERRISEGAVSREGDASPRGSESDEVVSEGDEQVKCLWWKLVTRCWRQRGCKRAIFGEVKQEGTVCVRTSLFFATDNSFHIQSANFPLAVPAATHSCVG